MSRFATRALLQRYYDAFNMGDHDGMLACLAQQVAHDINQGERQEGKAAFRDFLAHMDQCYREKLTDMAFMIDEDGSRAAAEFIVHGTYLASDEGLPPATGQTYRLPAGAFFDIEEGLITRVSVYYNLADWTAQVGG
jgi:steroid delta-isomerase-like uncharacterized protein